MRRPRPKVCFRRFSLVGRGRNAIFVILELSAVAESLFSLFFTRRPWPKAIFHRFLGFGHGRRAVFLVFRSSEASESRFFLRNSIYPRPRLNIFPFLGACRSTCSASFAPFGKECAIKFGLFNRIFQCVSPSCETIDEHVSRDY